MADNRWRMASGIICHPPSAIDQPVGRLYLQYAFTMLADRVFSLGMYFDSWSQTPF